MTSHHLAKFIFLGMALIVALFALSQALHEEVYAAGECSVYCVCEPVCAGYVGSKTCFDNENCNGQPGNPHNCTEYCAITK